MIKLSIYIFLLTALMLSSCNQDNGVNINSGSYPKLILRKSAVPDIIDGIEKYPLLEATFKEAKEIAGNGIESGIEVPFPKDAAGGYTHEKHRQNYLEMYNAGLAYQLTGKQKYAVFVRDMLFEYSKLYPTLGIHPEQKNQAPGKLFWQGLNESVWLVYAIQGYDCIHDFLTETEQKYIEENLFRKVVEFFTVGDSYSFDRVHNHGTWAVAGVGMTGIVLDDSLMVQKALYSTKLDGSGGFLKQIDELFSPDGYYAEGPYYQRYALMPFILFAQALDNNFPDKKIFEYRDSVLIKAVNTVLQLTNTDGNFYPINDAIKEKSWLTPEMICGTNIVYKLTGNKDLLDVAQKQGRILISAEGLAVAKSVDKSKPDKYKRKSMIISDGKKGDKGGLALLRIGKNEDQSTVLFKFSSQGMGHGHFDRLGYLLYDKGQEIIPDYGAARFLNVTAKDGGRYLRENETWAKQTIAHNTLVVDEKSNFNGILKNAEANNPQLLFADLKNDSFQIVSAIDSNCYEGADLKRTLMFFEIEGRRYLIDLFDITNDKYSSYDLPVYFNGQLLESNFKYSRLKEFMVLGKQNGYQHLIVDTKAKNLPATSSVTWMNGKGFYTLSAITHAETEFFIIRLGANDPDFNLRDQSGMLIRHPNSKNVKLLTVIEIHGDYNPESEAVMQSEGSIKNMLLFSDADNKVLVELELKNDKIIRLFLDLNFLESTANEIGINGKTFSWAGNYKLEIN